MRLVCFNIGHVMIEYLQKYPNLVRKICVCCAEGPTPIKIAFLCVFITLFKHFSHYGGHVLHTLR